MPRLTEKPLTAAFVNKVPPSDDRAEYPDATVRGLRLRVEPTGKKSWFVLGRADGKLVRERLGEFPTMSLADARLEAVKVLGELRKGTRPKATAAAKRSVEMVVFRVAEAGPVRQSERRRGRAVIPEGRIAPDRPDGDRRSWQSRHPPTARRHHRSQRARGCKPGVQPVAEDVHLGHRPRLRERKPAGIDGGAEHRAVPRQGTDTRGAPPGMGCCRP